MKLFEGKTYKYTLPDAMSMIEQLEKEKETWIKLSEDWKNIAQEEIRIQRRMRKKLKELGVTDSQIEEMMN